MIEARELPDKRAPAFLGKPYSAYCRLCWGPYYALYIDKSEDPDGRCIFNHSDREDCENWQASKDLTAKLAVARRSVNCDTGESND